MYRTRVEVNHTETGLGLPTLRTKVNGRMDTYCTRPEEGPSYMSDPDPRPRPDKKSDPVPHMQWIESKWQAWDFVRIKGSGS